MQFEYKHHRVIYQAWSRLHYHIKANNSAKDNRDDSSMSVSIQLRVARSIATFWSCWTVCDVMTYCSRFPIDCSIERTKLGLWFPTATEIDSTSSGRSGQITERDHSKAGRWSSRSAILNAEVRILSAKYTEQASP